MLKFISLRAAIGLLVAVACIAVLAIGVQSWNGAASPLALALTSIAALVLLVGLGALVSREPDNPRSPRGSRREPHAREDRQ